jgi:hypothetical protein
MAAAILVALFSLSAVDADAADDMPTAIVRLDNLALVPADDLAFAEGRAADVFDRIGVHVAWIDDEIAVRDHVRPPFTVVVIKSGPEPAVRRGIVDALGFADLSVSRAHVIYDRVEALTSRSQLSAASLLGDVIAHEHSSRGIMRSGVDVHVRALETFTSPQARQILSRLTHGR